MFSSLPENHFFVRQDVRGAKKTGNDPTPPNEYLVSILRLAVHSLEVMEPLLVVGRRVGHAHPRSLFVSWGTGLEVRPSSGSEIW